MRKFAYMFVVFGLAVGLGVWLNQSPKRLLWIKSLPYPSPQTRKAAMPMQLRLSIWYKAPKMPRSL